MKTVDCKNCKKQTVKSNGRYNEAVKNGWNIFCSIKCRYAFQEKSKEYSCARCFKLIRKTPAQIRQTKTNVFCSKSCAAGYNNTHKNTGTRRSKLESYLEEQLNLYLPELKFTCNDKKIIGAELDFYFPELKLAVEINGILHYQPNFGLDKLARIQEIDKEKTAKCALAGIKLHIIDVSREPHFTQNIKDKHWKTVKDLIDSAEQNDINNTEINLINVMTK